MMTDGLWIFEPLNSNKSLVAAAGTNIPSTETCDFLGVGVGVAPPSIIGSPGTFGLDMGVGAITPAIELVIGTAPVTGDSCTLNVALQVAPDTGSGGGYQPGTWQTINETGPMTVAQLTAGQVIRLPWSAVFPPNERPRFVRLLYQVPAGENFTAGTIASAFVTPVRDDYSIKYANRNYMVS